MDKISIRPYSICNFMLCRHFFYVSGKYMYLAHVDIFIGVHSIFYQTNLK